MPQGLIGENFLLENESGVRLYHDYASRMPIIDYHCHLPPAEVAEDRRFENLTQIWLAGDHYKWRAMRAAGVAERFVTGDAPDREKFQKWAETAPKTLRNPLYHWTHLELKRPLGIADRLLGPDTAQDIWDRSNARLAEKDFSCRGIMRQMDVRLVCTTDDPCDGLEHHAAIAADKSFAIQVLPTFRPDKCLAVDNIGAWNAWIDRLAGAANVEINSIDALRDALRRRHDFFHQMGCRLADHGLETVPAVEAAESSVAAAFAKARGGRPLDPNEALAFKSEMLYYVALLHHEKGWTQQFHLGAMRNNNARMFGLLGPDSGYDSMADEPIARPLSRFLDRLDRDNRLAKTVLYNLNPTWNDVLATMIGNFQDGVVPGKMQFGSGWWFLDQKDGMERQIESLSNQGLLSLFVGMLTDSRSFLSYTRHEYFRRILANLLGREIDAGLLPRDFELVGGMVRDICYNNAARYFGFEGLEMPSKA